MGFIFIYLYKDKDYGITFFEIYYTNVSIVAVYILQNAENSVLER